MKRWVKKLDVLPTPQQALVLERLAEGDRVVAGPKSAGSERWGRSSPPEFIWASGRGPVHAAHVNRLLQNAWLAAPGLPLFDRDGGRITPRGRAALDAYYRRNPY